MQWKRPGRSARRRHKFQCYTANQHRNSNSNIGPAITIHLHTDPVGLCSWSECGPVNLPKSKIIARLDTFLAEKHACEMRMRVSNVHELNYSRREIRTPVDITISQTSVEMKPN
ncbi:hypothetical protein EVAR_31552_1 [Eumeta japonica]|uniref:Uncharacterized protein n=1 Tax=Eumeta variegata TaxID=151549 RepID=A0A4C1V791_EUMVA|nr:hypothetical protein EVAR_31552_1 [Eumeta japonica]